MRLRDAIVGALGFSALYLIRNVASTSLWWALWLFVAGSMWLYYL